MQDKTINGDRLLARPVSNLSDAPLGFGVHLASSILVSHILRPTQQNRPKLRFTLRAMSELCRGGLNVSKKYTLLSLQLICYMIIVLIGRGLGIHGCGIVLTGGRYAIRLKPLKAFKQTTMFTALHYHPDWTCVDVYAIFPFNYSVHFWVAGRGNSRPIRI